MNNAVAAGSYADMKIVKTRSVMQVIVEIPIEQANSFVEMFGVSLPGAEIRVAIARLNEVATGGDAPVSASATPQPEAEGRDTPRRKFDEMSPSQQAGIYCGEPEFFDFLKEMISPGTSVDVRTPGKLTSADMLRHIMLVKSRSDMDPTAWADLASAYRKWRFERNLPEQRG